MRLSRKESDVLACVELRANLSMPEIRKETGYRDHTIRYALKQLEDRGIATPIPFVDLSKLGFTLYNVFFSFSSDKKQLKQQFLKELNQTGPIVWVAEFGGDFQYALEICARHISEVQSTLSALTEKFGNIFFQKSVSTQFAAHLLPRRYLSSKSASSKPLSIYQTGVTEKTDELDHRILEALAGNGGSSHRRVAQLLEMPLSTLELRVKKLREKEIISGYFYAVRPDQYGYGSYKLLVFGKGISPKLGQRLLQYGTQHPNIVSMYECLGNWDYEIGVEVPSPKDVPQVIQELYETFGDEINNIQMLSKFDDLKIRPFPSSEVRENKKRTR
ncbi:MAG: Lrp/AsnC family transcriptional regulator [Bdellovibrionales bacterium]|nr:Lrp/AsnC family transcriptional regulator [Bdellovibrionales bacterium]